MAWYKPALTLCSLQSDVDRAKRKNRLPRQTLADLAGLPLKDSLHVVGRLDRDSEGLLLLTNDGQFTARILSEACHKEYWAYVNSGIPSQEAISDMRSGALLIRGATTRPPLSVDLLRNKSTDGLIGLLPDAVPGMNRGGTAWLKVVLNEGKNRQVRKITGCAGHKTIRLCRVAIGSLRLENHKDLLVPGGWKYIEKDDVILE